MKLVNTLIRYKGLIAKILQFIPAQYHPLAYTAVTIIRFTLALLWPYLPDDWRRQRWVRWIELSFIETEPLTVRSCIAYSCTILFLSVYYHPVYALLLLINFLFDYGLNEPEA